MRRFASLAIVALLVATPAMAQNPNTPTDTTLYFHIFDTLNKFVINTQPMNAAFFEVGGSNFPTITGTPVNDAYGVEWDFNTIYGTSTAGPVEYQINENGKPRFHPERGIAADVEINPADQPVVYLYVNVRDIFGLNVLPSVLPAYTFDVTMRTGDDPGKDANYDAGDLIMSGSETFYVCGANEFSDAPISEVCSSAPLDHPVLVADAEGDAEVVIPMTLASNTIPKVEAFNIRLDWYQLSETPLVDEDQIAQGYLRFKATQDAQPRMEFSIMNPVYVEFLHPQVAAGTLLIHTGVNSPWGTYDVDADNMTVEINGPAQPETLKRVVSKNAHVHGLHDKAAEITYLWKFRDEKAPNGEYDITITVPNVRGNAEATATGGFTLQGTKAFGTDEDGNQVEATSVESNDTPAIAIPIIGLALLGLARRKP